MRRKVEQEGYLQEAPKCDLLPSMQQQKVPARTPLNPVQFPNQFFIPVSSQVKYALFLSNLWIHMQQRYWCWLLYKCFKDCEMKLQYPVFLFFLKGLRHPYSASEESCIDNATTGLTQVRAIHFLRIHEPFNEVLIFLHVCTNCNWSTCDYTYVNSITLLILAFLEWDYWKVSGIFTRPWVHCCISLNDTLPCLGYSWCITCLNPHNKRIIQTLW